MIQAQPHLALFPGGSHTSDAGFVRLRGACVDAGRPPGGLGDGLRPRPRLGPALGVFTHLRGSWYVPRNFAGGRRLWTGVWPAVRGGAQRRCGRPWFSWRFRRTTEDVNGPRTSGGVLWTRFKEGFAKGARS